MNKPVPIRGARLSCGQDRSYFPRKQQILQVFSPTGASKWASAGSLVKFTALSDGRHGKREQA